jgi:hypothetical protein
MFNSKRGVSAMKSWQVVRLVAGLFILLSLALGIYVNPNWLWFTAFVGVNLMQSGLTQWCLMEKILQKLGIQSGC